MGARPLRRAIQRLIEDPLADEVLKGNLPEGTVIVVDREASAGALRRMLRDARAALSAKRSILIFPEGTRVSPGEHAGAETE